MLSKNEVKYIQSLGHKKQRDELGLFIAEGPKLVAELLQSDFEIHNIYATEDWLATNQNGETKITAVTNEELARISQLQTPNQVLITAKQKTATSLIITKSKTLVLDGIQDPGNMGTIIRIADWFGISQVVCSTDSVELYNPKVVQATMGSICRVNVYYTPLITFFEGIKHLPVYGALLNGESAYEVAQPAEAVIVIGNESKGIRPAVKSFITHPVTIPRVGEAESLNAAVATGILLSHLVGKAD
ncbi:MAG: methyltransferase [Segetibacter sp.]|nr:methyltransferase [Segetibacter sp.]